jgi:hypothetical protein
MSYARGTIAALVDAVVPETPGADAEQAPGALAIDLDETVATAFNELQEAPEGPLRSLGYETMPFAPVLALLLDIGALELILRREREESLRSPKTAYAGGLFSRLGPEDRMRAVRLLESDGLFPALDERYENAPVGIVAYLMQGALFITMMAAYSDWGDDTESPQGWTQADYPGPADGYAVHMGYEVETFAENDYTPADGSDDVDDGTAAVATDGGDADSGDSADADEEWFEGGDDR